MELRYCGTRRDLMGTFGHRNVGLGLHQIFDFSTLHKFDPVNFHKDIIIFAYYPFFVVLPTFVGETLLRSVLRRQDYGERRVSVHVAKHINNAQEHKNFACSRHDHPPHTKCAS